MKISDIIKSDKLTLSFEVFPPKTDAAYESVAGAIDKIADLKERIANGTYNVSGKDIAAKIVNTALEDVF